MSFAAPLIPIITAGSTLISGMAQMQNANYQSAVATNNANLMAAQAERETLAANKDIADQDVAARAQIAEMVAQMNASGINSGTGSMLLRRGGAEKLAIRDRERLAQKRDIQLENTKRGEATQRAEAKALKKAGKLGLLTTLMSVPTSYLSSATMVNDYTRGRMTLSAPSFAGGR